LLDFLCKEQIMLPVDITIYSMQEVLKKTSLRADARRLTLYWDSGMNRAINLYDKYPNPPRAQALFARRPGSSWTIGWALLTEEPDGCLFDPHEDHVCFHVFVQESCRRQGVGTTLFRQAKEISEGKIMVVYHEDNPWFYNPLMTNQMVVGV